MRRSALFVAVLTLIGVLPAAPAAAADEPWQQVLDITFPTEPTVTMSDAFDACRSGCSRSHQATDLMGTRMMRLFSAVDGRVCRFDDGPEDSYGRHITICGDDGNRYRYLHLNNDTPGTDDGQAGLEHVYAPGVRDGARVARGQFIAYMGDSGNAESTAPHLHFDIYVPGVVNPYGEERINPYPSLAAALARGDIADGTALPTERQDRLSGPNRVETAVAVSRETWPQATHAVLATSTSPHGALIAGPLASVLDAPVLITGSDALDPAVVAELERLGADHVTLVGEVTRLMADVQAALPGAEVETLRDGDQFGTAALVANRVWELTGAGAGDGEAEPADELVVTPVDFDPMDPEQGVPTLVFFEHGDREGVVGALDGAYLPASLDRLYVSLAGVDPDDVDRVSFHRGDDVRRRSRINTERQWPYDLGGSVDLGVEGVRPWWDEAGTEALTVDIRWEDGSSDQLIARFEVGGSNDRDRPRVRRAIVALGEHEDPNRAWPDALGASWYGSVRGLPVLLTRTDEMPAATATAMATVEEAVVAGGSAAVSQAQVDTIAGLTGSEVTRLSGPDRYATAAAIADDLASRRLVDQSMVYVATGQNWPDAVTAGPAVAQAQAVLLLVDGGAGDSSSARDAFTVRAAQVDHVVVLGGTAAVSDDVARKVAYWSV